MFRQHGHRCAGGLHQPGSSRVLAQNVSRLVGHADKLAFLGHFINSVFRLENRFPTGRAPSYFKV